MKIFRYALLFVLIIAFSTIGFGQTISYTTAASTYSQDFNTLPSSGTVTYTGLAVRDLSASPVSASGMSGWYFSKNVGTGGTDLFTVENGSSTSGALKDYGTTSSTDRALGSLASGTYGAKFGALITNNTGGTLNKFTITFTGEQWRNGGNTTAQKISFEYKIGASTIDDASFTAATSLDFTSPIATATAAALDGNVSANRTADITATISGLTWTNGTVLAIRWLDANDPGNDHGLAIDGFSFSADVQPPTNYYYKGTGIFNDVANWGTNTDGSGTAPANFTADIQIFNIRNVASKTTSSAWTVSGTGSKIVAGDGTNALTLTISNGFAISGTFDVSANATVILQDATLPSFNSLSANSTLDYAQSGTVVVSNTSTYGNLKLTGGTKTFPSGTSTVTGNLVVDGVTGFSGSGTLNLGGNLTLQNGTTVTTGLSLTTNGSSTQTIMGNGIDLSLFRLTQSNSAGITLSTTGGSSNVIITGTSGGNLALGANKITTNSNYVSVSGPSGTLSRTSGYIIGNFKKAVSAATGTTIFEVGTATDYHPLTIIYTVAPTTSGTVTVSNIVPDYNGSDISSLDDGGYVFERRSNQYWTVTHTTIDGGTYNLTVDGDGQTGITDVANVRIIHSSDGTSFDLVGTHSDGSGNAIANRTGIDGSVSGRFYLGGKLSVNPLPVELVSFGASVQNANVMLTWKTATETNNAGFEIQKSVNNNWTKIGYVEGAGTSNTAKNYSFTDKNVFGSVSYRLKQIDRNGSYQYSNVVEIAGFVPTSNELMQNYPNPFNPSTSISYQLAASGYVTVKVYDMLGKEIATLVNGQKDAGVHNVSFNALEVPSGIYFYQLRAGNVLQTKRMMLVK